MQSIQKAKENSAPSRQDERSEQLAKFFHETYERLAPNFGYKTREASAKPWADVPEQNKQLMIAVCGEILASRREAGPVKFKGDKQMLDLGKVAYEAYFDHSQGKSLISGQPLPKWEDQRQEIKDAWHAAANAVMEATQ